MLLKDKIRPIARFENLNEDSQSVLEEAIVNAQSYLSKFAESNVFLQKITDVFGSSFDADKLGYFRQSWLNGDFEALPEIEIRSQEDLGGANGAFAASTNKIYLAKEYIAQNSLNSGAIVDVLLEEIGHFVDANINQLDTVGDEGEIFSAVVRGDNLNPQQLSVLKAENDQATISLDDEEILIEKADPGVILDEQGRATTFRLDIPIFADNPEQDLDKDGLNDEWENTAVQSLSPTLVFHEKEQLLRNPDHKAALFTRVTPVEVEENGVTSTYIYFLNQAGYTTDYGSPALKGVGGHSGDFSTFHTAWKYVDERTITLDRLWTKGHIYKVPDVITHQTNEIPLDSPDLPNLQFAKDGSLKIYVEQDKHSTWHSPIWQKRQWEVYDIYSGAREPSFPYAQRPDTYNVGEAWFHPSEKFTNDVNFLFKGERVWDDPDALFCGGLKCDKAKIGSWLGGLLGGVVSAVVGGMILGPVGAVAGGIGGGIGFSKLGKKIDGVSPGYIGGELSDNTLESLFDESKPQRIRRKGNGFYGLKPGEKFKEEITLTIDRIKYLNKGGGDFKAGVKLGEDRPISTDVVNVNGNEEIDFDWSFTYVTEQPLVEIEIDPIDKENLTNRKDKSNKIDDIFAKDINPDISPLQNERDLIFKYDLYEGNIVRLGKRNNAGENFGVEQQEFQDIKPDNNGQFSFKGVPGKHQAEIKFTIIPPDIAKIIPDGTLELKTGFDSILGSDTNENISIRHVNGKAGNETIEINPNGIKQSYGNGTEKGTFNRIKGFAGDGNDTIVLDGVSTTTYLGGGKGDDRIEIINSPVGETQASIIAGGDGNDTIRSGAGNDLIDGGSGEDRLTGSDGDDYIIGGGNNDYIQAGTGDDIASGDNVNPGNDTIFGGAGEDIIAGGGSTDYLDAGEGDDLIFGDLSIVQPNEVTFSTLETGAEDTILGGNGSDVIFGEWGDDEISGNDGADSLYGGVGDDTLKGGSENDIIEGNDGNDHLEGGTGDDLLIVEAGNDLIDGGDGIDTISYSKSPNGITVNLDETNSYQSENSISASPEPNFTIASGTAEDGFETTDTLENLENIVASQQDDILIGNSSANKIEALDGNDLLIGNGESNIIDGGNGNDTVSYRRETDKVNVDLETRIGAKFSGDTDTLISIENVIGSAGDDEIIGDENSNFIFGEEGKDSLQGKQGDDKLIGGKDGDVIDGGEGNDTASYFTATEGVTANLTNTQENTGDAQGDSFQSIENLEGSEFGDRLIADTQNNDIQGLGGDDYLDGLTGDDTMSGGTGNDTYKIENVNDVVIENIDQGIDTVDAAIDYILGANLENLNLLEGTAALNGTGNELNNIINGNSGDNVIFGGDGDDSIIGGLGRESSVSGSLGKINGTPGSDILTGGNGNDAFIYNNIADTGDLITDFTVGDDKIVVTELLQSLGYGGSNPINDGFLGFKQASDSLAVLQIDPDGAASDMFNPMPFILLDNVSIAALNDSSNFVF